jgi:hypothetical protein
VLLGQRHELTQECLNPRIEGANIVVQIGQRLACHRR